MTAYHVVHETRYRYVEEVVSSHNEAHLLPRSLARQVPTRLQLRIEPTPDSLRWHQDYFGNDVVFFNLQTPHRELTIRTQSDVELEPPPRFEPKRSAPWEEVAAAARLARTPEALEAFEFVFDSPFVPTSEALAEYARPSCASGRPLAEAVLDFSRRIHAEFRYDPEATTLETPVADALRERHGVCQDFAHVMIGGLRSLGLPARYVSGYLKSRRAAKPDAGPARPDASDLVGSEASHAWVAAWCPTLGWIEVDPTNDLVPGDRHIVLAYGRDYDDVSPVKGVTLGGGSHTVEVAVEVTPIEAPGA